VASNTDDRLRQVTVRTDSIVLSILILSLQELSYWMYRIYQLKKKNPPLGLQPTCVLFFKLLLFVAGKSELQGYDAFQRNPLHCHAQSECLWELLPLTRHHHPSVSLFAVTLLQVSSHLDLDHDLVHRSVLIVTLIMTMCTGQFSP
jgi:hypothetical protein